MRPLSHACRCSASPGSLVALGAPENDTVGIIGSTHPSCSVSQKKRNHKTNHRSFRTIAQAQSLNAFKLARMAYDKLQVRAASPMMMMMMMITIIIIIRY